MNSKFYTIALGLFFLAKPIYSQDTIIINQVNSPYKFEISGGIGFPEILFGKVKYGSRNTQIGLGLAFDMINIEMYYHFAGKSKFTQVKPWYGSAGVYVERYYKERGYNIRFGRSFNFSEKTGLNLDLGAVCDQEYLIFPLMSIGFFIRFKSPF
jgi:hypothetical protein